MEDVYIIGGIAGIIGGFIGYFLVNWRIFTIDRRLSALEAKIGSMNREGRVKLTGIPIIDNLITEVLKDPENINMIIDTVKEFFSKKGQKQEKYNFVGEEDATN